MTTKRKITKEEVWLVHNAVEAEMEKFRRSGAKSHSLESVLKDIGLDKAPVGSSEVKKGRRPPK